MGWGGALHFVASPNGQRSEGATMSNGPVAVNDVINEWNVGGAGSFSDYYNGCFGGPMAMLPGGLSNHKPGAFYFGDFYYFQHNVEQLGGSVFLLRYDGSGIFQNGRNGAIYANKSHSGRGVKLLSPSGNSPIHTKALCAIVHNDILFYVGAIPVHDQPGNAVNSWSALEDWNQIDKNLPTTGADGGTSLPRRRAYGAFTIHKKTRNGKDFRDAAGNLAIKYNRFTPAGLAPDYECLHACDAISLGDDIIYANNCDIMRFPGGSGIATFVERNNIEISSKCFEIYPSGGFLDSSPIGESQLMILSGSGTIKKINLPGDGDHNPSESLNFGNGTDSASGVPFGTRSLIDLGQFVSDFNGPKVRTGGFRGRLASTFQEPSRSCLLRKFDNKLHAFFISSTSGYYHFVCDGDPRGKNNWQDRTAFVPDEIKLFDGDLFGYTDDHFGTLNVSHVAKANVGVFGMIGGDRGAGGWSVYSLDTSLAWKKVARGAGSAPPCGLIPYDPTSVSVQVASGGVVATNPQIIPSTDYALLTYQLIVGRAPNRLTDIDIDFSIDDGITWNTATQFKDYVTGLPLGEGKISLTASPPGTEHEFYWAHVTDVGFNVQNRARLRIRPKLK